MKKSLFLVLCFFLAAGFSLFAGGGQEAAEPASSVEMAAEKTVEEVSTAPTEPVRLGIFVPGRLGDSPPYDGMAEAAEKVAPRNGMIDLVKIYEAGFDQSKWPEMLLTFAASGNFDVICIEIGVEKRSLLRQTGGRV